MGWTLPSFSWYIDQTVAGAVATATHGSSMKYGSISGQVRRNHELVTAQAAAANSSEHSGTWTCMQMPLSGNSIFILHILGHLLILCCSNCAGVRAGSGVSQWDLGNIFACIQPAFLFCSTGVQPFMQL